MKSEIEVVQTIEPDVDVGNYFRVGVGAGAVAPLGLFLVPTGNNLISCFQISTLQRILQRQRNNHHLLAGVVIIDAGSKSFHK